ncbi:hypothetical protein MNBD_PLANCTO03-681 [hydrothermal vent metagenome]|uniref:PEP-CTERM protein-sorting domain-containing protein n=1 Tax=hydrothermal vent metagenome TaxID=652676 RepID=A0A3B1DTP1_9ZZZZ
MSRHHRSTVALAALTIAAAAHAQTVWYNGDPDLVNGLSAEFNTNVTDAYVFEDFNFGGGTITDIWGNFFMDFNAVGFMYEIRSNVSNGFGGVLHASGNTNGSYSQALNGFNAFGYDGYEFRADIPDIFLGAGTYMLALSPIGSGQGNSFVQSTSGLNGVGSPNDNDLNWFQSIHWGTTYFENYLQGSDFSYGVNVPAPASVALLGLGGLIATRRRRG